MANVRIDSQGVPKAPVYEGTTPVLHRAGVTGADTVDPTSASAGSDCAGYRNVRFDLDTGGSVGLTALTVQLLAWNPTAAKRRVLGLSLRYVRGGQAPAYEQRLTLGAV